MGTRFVRGALLSTAMVLWISSACSDSPTSPTGGETLPAPEGTAPRDTPVAIRACATTTPDDGSIDVGETVALNASCSESSSELVRFGWDLGDGRQRSGRVIHARFKEVGDYLVRLTVADAEGHSDSMEIEIHVRVPLHACVEWERAPDGDPYYPCGFRFDASCSTGDIQEYRWFFQGNPDWPDFDDETVTTSEPQVGYSWGGDIECLAFRPFERIVRVTVVATNGETDTAEEVVQFTRPLREP